MLALPEVIVVEQRGAQAGRERLRHDQEQLLNEERQVECERVQQHRCER
jgi:hypothetical protein